MNKFSKKSLNAVLALLIVMNLGGCTLFEKDDKEDDKETTNKNENKNRNDKDAKKKEDKDTEDNNNKIKEDEPYIEYSSGGNSYTPSYPNRGSSQNTPPSKGDSNSSKPNVPDVVIKADFTKLHSLLVECKHIDTSGYTPKSVSIFQKAMNHAEIILNTTASSQYVVDQEVRILEMAKMQLTLIADFSGLSEIMKVASEVDVEKYTPISISALNKSMNKVQVVLDDKNASQAKVNETITLLQESIKSLILRANFDVLKKTVESAKQIRDEDYTDASLEPMYASLKTSESIIKNLNASQKAVDEANADLQSRLDALVVYVAPDKTDLTNLIAQAKVYKENEYSISSYSTLKEAIKNAEDTLNIRKVTQPQITIVKASLQKAINELNVDLSALKAELIKAKAIDEMTYTPSSYKGVKDAIDSTDVFLSTTHKQYEIDAQEKVLTDSIKQLIKRADKKDLQKAINDAKATYAGDYTVETMDILKATVSDAEIVLSNLDATQEEVSIATKKVNDAIAQLKVVIHKDKLEVVINKSKDIKEIDYTPNTYQQFKVAYDQAISVNNNQDATQKQVDDSATALESAFASLVKRANITLLNQKITEAEAIIQDNYTDASLIKFNSELSKSKELVKDLNVSQVNVDSQLTSLTNAINDLVAYVVPNMDAINQAIHDAENVKASDWSSASYDVMVEKLNNAKEMINKKKVTQTEIDQAKDELTTAYNALSVDVSVLNDTLTTAKTYKEINYTLDSYNVLQTAITHTENFLKATHTQKEINEESTELQTAINQLVLFEEADKIGLTTTINQAKTINANEYTQNSYNVLSTAITKAETVRNNYRATVNEINTAINELDSAKANLVKRANLTALNEVITEAKTKYSGGFTTSSINALKAIVTEAETILSNTNASQNEVDTKTLAIKTAISNLIKLGDKTALTSLIDELDALQENDYTPVSWASASLGSVIADAKAIRDKAEATDGEVNTALDALTQAKASLVKKADITELTNEITKAQAELSKGYTTASKNVLSNAIGKAQTVVNNPNAIATEVSTALADLRNAIAGLKVDVAPLVSEINIAKGTNTTNKLPSTVTILMNAIKDAETYKDSASVTFEGMDEQIQKLKDAVNGLQDKTDTSALITKLNEAKVLNSKDYTVETFVQLQTAITNAENVLNNENATQQDINNATDSLTTAMNDLEFVPTVANKRKECEQVIAQGYALLNDTSLQLPSNYRTELKTKTESADGLLAYCSDDELSVQEIQTCIDGIKTAMKNFNDNLYDVQGFILKCQAKIAEARAMDTTGFSENSVYSMLHYATHLEESIAAGQSYVYLESAYGWLMEAIGELAPADQTVYVNEQAPAEVLALLNAERKQLGLTELVMDTKLCEATTIRATEAKDQTGLFVDWAHKRPDGRKWNTVLDEINYHQSFAGENAASGYASGTSVYNGWINSPGHKDNMLTPSFTKVGISMIKVGEGQWISYMILAN